MVFDYAGNVLSTRSISSFITAAGGTAGTINDLVVDWNEFAQRWVVGCSCANDQLFVSAGTDATGAWQVTRLANIAGDLTIKLGHDKNGEYVSEYSNGGYADSNNRGPRSNT